jgi:lysozyme
MLDAVIDISHDQPDPIDFAAVRASGVLAVIHKATEGTGFVDPKWAARRPAILAAGLLFGTYHFLDDTDGAAQAAHYLATIGAQPGELLMFDFEHGSPSPSLQVASDAVQAVVTKAGVSPVFYTGRWLTGAGGNPDAAVLACPLFLAEYGPTPHTPPGWASWSLWQHTGSGAVPGITGAVDRDYFNGDAAGLTALWQAHSIQTAPAASPASV